MIMATTYPIKWDQTGEKKYENGVSKGVLYTKVNGAWVGVAWNGLTAVTESPEGADKTDLWADNQKYASMRAAETFGGTIEAYTYPPEFEACNGEKALNANTPGIVVGQQTRAPFCLCYRTEQGNDELGADYGYKLHLIYNCTCSPSERAYETINDSPDAITFSWEFDSTPADAGNGLKQTSCITIDSTKLDAAKLAKLEDILYGKQSTAPTIPFPDELIAKLNAA